ncbi:hypothetical protein, partial [Victivallis vadensis]|uniref:hypothetical protein n=1 Tax=Victivallis vadensis TaxID=172901 RepID=UPI003AF939BE
VLSHCGRHPPALHFKGSGSRACALPPPSTSAVRALDCARQAAGGDAAEAAILYLLFFGDFL